MSCFSMICIGSLFRAGFLGGFRFRLRRTGSGMLRNNGRGPVWIGLTSHHSFPQDPVELVSWDSIFLSEVHPFGLLRPPGGIVRRMGQGFRALDKFVKQGKLRRVED